MFSQQRNEFHHPLCVYVTLPMFIYRNYHILPYALAIFFYFIFLLDYKVLEKAKHSSLIHAVKYKINYQFMNWILRILTLSNATLFCGPASPKSLCFLA